MTEFVALRLKTYSYLMDDGNANKKPKAENKCVTEEKLKHSNYKNCLLNNEAISKLQQRLKSKTYNVYNEEVKRLY